MLMLSALRCVSSDRQLTSHLKLLESLPSHEKSDAADWLRRVLMAVSERVSNLPRREAVSFLDTVSILAEKEVRFSKGSTYLSSHPASRAAPVEIVWLRAKINLLLGKIDAGQLQRIEARIWSFVGEPAVAEPTEQSNEREVTPGQSSRRAKSWQSRSWMRADTVHAVKGSDSRRRRATRQD